MEHEEHATAEVHDLPSLEEWCRQAGHPARAVRTSGSEMEHICDPSAPLAQRLNLLHVNHPTAICRRDRVGIMAALEAIDLLRSQVAELRAEIARMKEAADGPPPHP